MRGTAWLFVLVMAPAFAGCFGAVERGIDDSPTGLDTSLSFLQQGANAAGHNFVPGAGPQWPDVALVIPFEGIPDHVAPVLIGRHAYLPVGLAEGELDVNDIPGSALIRIDVDTGEVEEIDRFDSWAMAIGSDGERIFLAVTELGVVAYPVGGGARIWTRTWNELGAGPDADLPAPIDFAICASIAVRGPDLTILCDVREKVPDPTGEDGFLAPPGTSAFVLSQASRFLLGARLDAKSGEARWTWTEDVYARATADFCEPPIVGELPCPAPATVLPAVPLSAVISAPSVVEETVLFQGVELRLDSSRSVTWALDNATGVVKWRFLGPEVANEISVERFRLGALNTGRPTGADGIAYVKSQSVFALDLEEGSDLWSEPLGEQDYDPAVRWHSGDVALVDDTLYAASSQAVYRFDVEDRQGWRQPMPLGTGEGFEEGPLVVGDVVLLGGWNPETETAGGVYAYDADDGSLLWRLPRQDPGPIAASDGVLVFTDVSARAVTVLGRTAASLTAVAEVSSEWPAVGEEILVDFSATEAGIQGPATGFRAVWGDGTETEWEDETVLSHSYAEAGDVTARFIARNDAGQTASTTLTFHVGQRQPTLLSAVFAPENHDLTFGILGVLLVVGGALVAVFARRRRLGRLQRELAAIDGAAASVRDNPTRLAAAMEERRAHSRALLVDGTIDESQYTVLEKHIEAVGRAARVHQMADLVEFLPHALFTALEEMLADGRVTRWERDGFKVLLRENRALTPAQKRKVATRVDEWFSQDEESG
jgi:hypothetical protein